MKVPDSGPGCNPRGRVEAEAAARGTHGYWTDHEKQTLATAVGRFRAGTWGGGAARWDGKAWTNLTTREGLAGNIVYSITQGSDGALWFGTNNGVTRWDGKAFTNFGMKEGLLEVPGEVVIRTAIFHGEDAVEIPLRFRWMIDEGKLGFMLVPPPIEDLEQSAIDDIIALMQQDLVSDTIVEGIPPA